jgi:hypothetical protein
MGPTEQEHLFPLTLDDRTSFRNVVYIKCASDNNHMQNYDYLNESTIDINLWLAYMYASCVPSKYVISVSWIKRDVEQ